MANGSETDMYILVAMHAVILILLFAASHAALVYIQKTNSLRHGITELYERLNGLSGYREEVGMRLKSLYGNMGTRGFITHIEDNLEYSGATARFTWLTPELYVVVMIAVSAAMSVLVSVFAGRLYVGLIAAAVTWFLPELVFASLRNYRYRREEEQLMAFVNSVESCAAESDDIIYILEKSAGMTEGPLSEALIHTVTLVKSGIQGAMALRQLENRIEHSFFKMLIRNLEISSRNNANYREITKQCRNLLAEQLDNGKKLEGIYHEAKIRLGVVLLCAIVCLGIMAQTMLGMSLTGMFSMFTESFAGCCLIAMICGTLAFTAYFVFAKGKRGRRG